MVIIGGMPFERYGRALGPYRVRTSCQRAGFSASVVDFPWVLNPVEMKEILDYLVGSSTLAIGLSCTWESDVDSGVEWLTPYFIQTLRQNYPGVQIILGVANTSRIKRNLLPEADWIVGGFSEDSTPELLNHLAGFESTINYHEKVFAGKKVNFVNGNTDHIVKDMDQLATIFEKQDYYTAEQPLTIETCRGCVFSCAFCTYPFLGKKNYDYIRSVESLADELRRNFELFGTTRYMIADDTFNDSLEKIDRIRRAVDKAKLPKFEYVCYIRPELMHLKPEQIPALIDSGLKGAFFGVESFSNVARKAVGRVNRIEHVLDAIANLKSAADVKTHGSFITGLPGDSVEDVEGWKEFLVGPKNVHFNCWFTGPLWISINSLSQQISTKGAIQSTENKSLIELDPGKYGYEIIGSEDNLALWKNEHMTFQEARALSVKFNKETAYAQSVGGWHLGSYWYHGLSRELIEQKGFARTRLQALGIKSCYERARKVFADIRAAN